MFTINFFLDNAIFALEGGAVQASTSTTAMGASFAIPKGYKATHIKLYGSDIYNEVTVFSNDITNSANTYLGYGLINTEIDITDVISSDTNYLSLLVYTGNGDYIYGGYIRISPIE